MIKFKTKEYIVFGITFFAMIILINILARSAAENLAKTYTELVRYTKAIK